MSEIWIGLVAGRNDVLAVQAEVPDDDGPLVIQADHAWPLQQGNRAAAYRVLHQQVVDYCREHHITRAIVKESALNRGGTKKVHLEAAEVRGVVIAAASTVAQTEVIAKAKISKTFGGRKADDYIADNDFWAEHVTGRLKVGSREPVLLLLATRSA